MSDDFEAALNERYGFDAPALTFGAAMRGDDTHPAAQVRVPLGMMNRHGLVAGATGTGKTKTLQVLAEQLSDAGVPVFISDIKGDISGLSAPAQPNEKLTARASAIGFSDYAPKAFPVEFLTLDRDGKGVRLRASVSSFGPILLAKVLDLNDTQQSVLALAFKYSDDKQLPLVNLEDLRSLLNHLNSDEGGRRLGRRGRGGCPLRALRHLQHDPPLRAGDPHQASLAASRPVRFPRGRALPAPPSRDLTGRAWRFPPRGILTIR